MIKHTVYGLPLNPTTLLPQLAGSSFCVSYATRDKLGKQLAQAIDLVGDDGILLVDNGAFSLWMAAQKAAKKTGQPAAQTMTEEYLDGFGAWANDILDRCPQAIAVLPDQIDGDEARNAQLVAETMSMFPTDRVMPVWHMHESFEYLLQLCEGFAYVAIGSSGEYAQPGTEKWTARLSAAMAAITQWEEDSNGGYVRPRIHMMRAQSEAHRFDFDSSDSTNVAVNHGRYRATGEGHVARFAARIDAKIQASAGPEAEHQIARPLLDHVEHARWQKALYGQIWASSEAGDELALAA
jgi:hypothetical protein